VGSLARKAAIRSTLGGSAIASIATLERVDWNSRLVRTDVGEELARLRGEFDGDMDVGGATLAASFIRRGLVDEFRLLVHPVVIGSGTPFFPPLDTPIPLRLIESGVFKSGVTYLGHMRST
jgi:dihydrofolate reductase